MTSVHSDIHERLASFNSDLYQSSFLLSDLYDVGLCSVAFMRSWPLFSYIYEAHLCSVAFMRSWPLFSYIYEAHLCSVAL